MLLKHARSAEVVCYALAFSWVAMLGLANLYHPFGPDQANVFLGAQAMAGGDRLYLDYWDNKQPGLYLFYLAAGLTFGFDEQGVHLLEFIWLMLFAIVLAIGLRGTLRYRWLSAVAPIATVGVYYAAVTEYELSQLEFLVSLPIVLSLWASARPFARSLRFFLCCFASGLLAAFAVTFKLALTPLFIVIWGAVTLYRIRYDKRSASELIRWLWLPALCGVVLCLSLVVLGFWLHGALEPMLWTAFVYPSEVFASAPAASKSRLVTAFTFFASNYAPWALFVGIGLLVCWRERSLSATLYVAWLAVAIGLFLIQSFSWWSYHTLLAFTPAGLLAVIGLDRAVDWLCREPAGAAGRSGAVAGLLAIPLAASLAVAFIDKAQPLISNTKIRNKGIRAHQFEVGESYRHLWETSRFLRENDLTKTNLPGPIYAFAHPMVYPFARREPAHITSGSSWEFYTPQQTRDLLDTLERKRVPYILVGRFDRKLLDLRPQIAHYLRRHYVVQRRGKPELWFRRRDPRD